MLRTQRQPENATSSKEKKTYNRTTISVSSSPQRLCISAPLFLRTLWRYTNALIIIIIIIIIIIVQNKNYKCWQK